MGNSPTTHVDPTGEAGYIPHQTLDADGNYHQGLSESQLAGRRFLDVLYAVSKVWIVPGGANRCHRWVEVARDRIIALAEEHAKCGNDPKDIYDNPFYIIEYVEFGFTGKPPMPGWTEHAALKITFKKTGQVFYLDNGTIDGLAHHRFPGGFYLPWGKMTTPEDVALCPGGWFERRTDPLDEAKGKPGYFPWTEMWILLKNAFQ